MSPAAVQACIGCGRDMAVRSRKVLGEVLDQIAKQAVREGADPARALVTATGQLLYVASELRGLCGNCTTQAAGEAFAAAQIVVKPVEPVTPSFGTFYERAMPRPYRPRLQLLSADPTTTDPKE